MPTAQNKGGGGKSLSMNIFGPAGAGGGPVAALITQQAESQKQFQKMLQTIEKLQQQNAEAVQQASQAGAGAATQVANQVAQGMERAKQENQRSTEREEDKAFARESQELNAQLQAEAAKEAAAMGQAISAQQTNMMNYAEQFKAKKGSMNQTINAYAALIDRRLEAGHFSSPQGRKELAQHKHLMDMMQANSDDHYSDKHLAAAFRQYSADVQNMIARGQTDMDLANLQVDPLKSPLAEVEDRGGRVAGPGSVSPDKMFELKMMGGYPKNGVVFNEEENFGLPAGNYPRIDDADAFLQVLSRDQYLILANDKAIRQELTRKNQDVVVKALDRLQPLYEAYTNFNQVFNPMAPQAIEASLEAFLAKDDLNKFNDIGREITAGAVLEIFGGGSNGERMAQMAMEIFDGKREPSTPEEAFIGMALESALFNIKEHMLSEFMTFDDKGAGASTELVQQMVEEMGEENALRALGVDPSSSAPIVRAHDIMQQHLGSAHAYVNQMHRGVWNGSALEDFRRDLKTNTVLADIYSFQSLKDADGVQTRLMKITGQNELMQGAEASIAGLTPEEAEARVGRDRSDLEKSFSLLDGMIELADGLGPDAIRGVANLASAGIENNDTPNLQKYLDFTRKEAENSGYVKSVVDRVGHRAKRQADAKKNPPVAQSYEQGGVPQVVQEQLPALIGSAGRGLTAAAGYVTGSAIKTGEAMQQAAGGRPAADAFRRGANVLQGTAPPMSQEEHQRTQNLSPDEMRQIGQYQEDE